jgi:hypothetical protein
MPRAPASSAISLRATLQPSCGLPPRTWPPGLSQEATAYLTATPSARAGRGTPARGATLSTWEVCRQGARCSLRLAVLRAASAACNTGSAARSRSTADHAHGEAATPGCQMSCLNARPCTPADWCGSGPADGRTSRLRGQDPRRLGRVPATCSG